jgi:hypothetical protein
MVSIKGAFPVPVLFVALIVALDVPDDVGEPEINPLAALTLNPAGNPVAPKLVGLFVATI